MLSIEEEEHFLDEFAFDEKKKDCYTRRILPLLNEFFRTPCSLQQLSRATIRRSIGMNGFERRAKALPLPRPLREYVWRANEELVVMPPPGALEFADQSL